MGNKFAKLTDDLLAQVKQPKTSSNRFMIRDSLVAGFFVTVSSRSISYGLTVNEQGKRKALSLGKYPHLSVIKARQAALELQTSNDIIATITHRKTSLKQQQQTTTNLRGHITSDETLAELIARYGNIRQLKPRTLSDIHSLCKRYLPSYLDNPAHQLTPSIYQPIYLDLVARGVVTSSKQLSRYLSAIYTWAELPNPIGDLSKKTGNSIYSGNARDRRLESYQLNDFKRIMTKLTHSQQLVIVTALVTGLRKNELAQISPESLHKATQSIIVSQTKNGKVHRLPLPERLYERLEKQSLLVTNQQPMLAVTERLPRSLIDVIPLSWHDLRRTTASTLASLGANEYVIKRVLNHTNKQDVTATHYARIDETVIRQWLSKLYDHFT